MLQFDAGMEINIQGSILETKCMDLEFTILQMDTVMKEHGMKVVDKVMVFIHFETETEDVVNGTVVTSSTLYHHKLRLSLHQLRYLSLRLALFAFFLKINSFKKQ